jgi:DNA repair exonuclease SbcCD ATPase subunit
MATTETTLDRSSETNDLSDQQVDSVAEDNRSKSNVSAAASQDVADILSILDGLGAQKPATDQLPKGTLLTAEEQDRLADLLGDTKPKVKAEPNEQAKISGQLSSSELENKEIQDTKTAIETPLSYAENNAKQTEFLQTESALTTKGHGNKDKLTSVLDAIQNESSDQSKTPLPPEIKDNSLREQSSASEHTEHIEANFSEQEQAKLNDLLTKAQSQIEAVTVERNTLSKELVLTRALLKELENDQPDNKAEKPKQAYKNRDIKHLSSELTKITNWHKILTVQVQKLLKVVENSNAESETLEANLIQSHETICKLKKKVQPLQDKLKDYESMVTDLRNQLVDQTAMLTTNHEKLLQEVSQRRKAEQMLRNIKSRFAPLTRTRKSPNLLSESYILKRINS